MRFDLDRVCRHQRERLLILRHRLDGAADERLRQHQLDRAEHHEGEHAGDQHTVGQVDEAKAQRRTDCKGAST